MTTDDDTLNGRYLEWLYAKSVGVVRNRNPARSYWKLAEILFQKEFIWFIPNDDNRVEDGRELREEFLDETAAERDQNWLEEGCSMLEMLIALGRRCAFEASEEPFEWFWVLADNLGLRSYVDSAFTNDAIVDIEAILDRVNERSYLPDGRGGLFPLRNADVDQTKVEIWYQMAAYLMENDAS